MYDLTPLAADGEAPTPRFNERLYVTHTRRGCLGGPLPSSLVTTKTI